MKYNIGFEIAGLIILSVIIFALLTTYKVQKEKNKYFKYLVYSIFLAEALDVLTAITISYGKFVPVPLNMFLNSLYFISATIASAVAVLYLTRSTECKTKTYDFIALGIVIVYSAAIIFNIFFGFLFYFDGTVYVRGPFSIVNYIGPLVMLLLFTFHLIIHRKDFVKYQFYADLSFVLLNAAFVIIQIFFPDVLLTQFGMSVAVMVSLFTFETPYYQRIEYLEKNLEVEVAKKTEQISIMSVETIEALAETIDSKDDSTKGHSIRVAKYSKALALKVGFTKAEAEELYNCALLHDIGKIGIPDAVLKKNGRLTDDEYAIIKGHTQEGEKILATLITLPLAKEVARHHHERYDGKGYPDGLSGKDIHKYSRVVSICDSFDAMNSNRVYRTALSKEKIIEELRNGKGTQFDPDYLPSFLELLENNEI